MSVLAKTIHGWPVIEHADDVRLHLFTIPGCPKRKMRLREDVGPYLVAFASEYHRLIAPLDEGTFDDWAWSPLRLGRASSSVSDHCGGVAIDLNATREGAQSSSNLTWWNNPIRRVKLARLRKRFSLLEWGGDYKHFRDPMHWTFMHGVDQTAVKRAIRRMGIQPDGSIAA